MLVWFAVVTVVAIGIIIIAGLNESVGRWLQIGGNILMFGFSAFILALCYEKGNTAIMKRLAIVGMVICGIIGVISTSCLIAGKDALGGYLSDKDKSYCDNRRSDYSSSGSYSSRSYSSFDYDYDTPSTSSRDYCYSLYEKYYYNTIISGSYASFTWLMAILAVMMGVALMRNTYKLVGKIQIATLVGLITLAVFGTITIWLAVSGVRVPEIIGRIMAALFILCAFLIVATVSVYFMHKDTRIFNNKFGKNGIKVVRVSPTGEITIPGDGENIFKNKKIAHEGEKDVLKKEEDVQDEKNMQDEELSSLYDEESALTHDDENDEPKRKNE